MCILVGSSMDFLPPHKPRTQCEGVKITSTLMFLVHANKTLQLWAIARYWQLLSITYISSKITQTTLLVSHLLNYENLRWSLRVIFPIKLHSLYVRLHSVLGASNPENTWIAICIEIFQNFFLMHLLWTFLLIFGGHQSFCGTTDTLILDFW